MLTPKNILENLTALFSGSWIAYLVFNGAVSRMHNIVNNWFTGQHIYYMDTNVTSTTLPMPAARSDRWLKARCPAPAATLYAWSCLNMRRSHILIVRSTPEVAMYLQTPTHLTVRCWHQRRDTQAERLRQWQRNRQRENQGEGQAHTHHLHTAPHTPLTHTTYTHIPLTHT